MVMREHPRMHIFVYEYLSSGAAGDVAAPSLLTEGWAMLSALVEDLALCPGVRVSTLLDSQRTLPRHWNDRIDAQRVQPATEKEAFRELAAAADWSLVIAPEFDGILAERSWWVEEAGGRLLGSSPKAIDETADKLLLSRLWSEQGIPTPSLEASYPLVCKPRFGAGSQATFLVQNEEELAQAKRKAHAEDWSGELILQRCMPGLAASAAFLAGGGKRYSLPAGEQRLSSDGRFHYLGGRLPLPDHLDRRARHLAERAVECVEGLHGWFGVDLILGDAEDGSGDAVIEINPRLTTSYLGMRQLARFNLAEALLAAATGAPMPPWAWRTGSVVFESSGTTN
jgi:predicted ATP-grasp superfamily ATP-dependent carboligase